MKRSRLFSIDRYTQIDEMASGLKRILRKTLWPLAVLCLAEGSYLFFTGKPGASAFAMITGSFSLTFLVWSRGGIGLPILPVLAAQNLIIYASPIVFGHEAVAVAGEAHVFQAGLEVMIFGVTLTAAWKMGMQVMAPSKAISYVLVDVDRDGIKGLNRLGFALAGTATLYLLLQSAGLADIIISHLPTGSNSIFVAVVSAAATCGFFMIALSFGSGTMTQANKLTFWTLLIVNTVVTASSFLLSSVGGIVAAVAIGLFWGSGRMPWRFSIAVALLLSFFNMGKFAMRDRYWSMDSDNPVPDTTFADLPSHYSEWIQASFDAATKPTPTTAAGLDQDRQTASNRQSLMDRIDNLQNMLFVIDAEDSGHIEPVHGATYTLIPSLLIPRIFWPDKPRSHEGQIILNVHFGRQDLNSTFKTYVAWGLLPEAYGNYGPIWGSLFLGAIIGLASAWIENKTARKLVISLEGIIGFGLLLNLLNSFEMVASVLVTSTFQNMVPVIFAFAPFVRRQTLHRPEPDAK